MRLLLWDLQCHISLDVRLKTALLKSRYTFHISVDHYKVRSYILKFVYSVIDYPALFYYSHLTNQFILRL